MNRIQCWAVGLGLLYWFGWREDSIRWEYEGWLRGAGWERVNDLPLDPFSALVLHWGERLGWEVWQLAAVFGASVFVYLLYLGLFLAAYLLFNPREFCRTLDEHVYAFFGIK